MERRALVGLIAFALLAAPFFTARAANTPAQDRALQAWNSCPTGPTTARLDQIEAAGLRQQSAVQGGAMLNKQTVTRTLVLCALTVAALAGAASALEVGLKAASSR